MEQELNNQFIQELYNSNLYLSMGFFCYEDRLPGMGEYFCNQAEEERMHALKFSNYMIQNEIDVILTPIESVPLSWPDIAHAFQSALMAEKINTAKINNLYSIAESMNDTNAMTFLKWFVDEQIKEVAEAQENYDKILAANNNQEILQQLDNEFKQNINKAHVTLCFQLTK